MRTVFSGFRGRERATGNNIDLVDLESPSAAPVQILSAKDVRPTRYLAAIFAAFGGILISLSAFFAVSSWEHRLADVKLRELAKNYQQTLNSDLEKATDLLYTLRANFATTNNTLSRGEFQAFARDLRGRLPGLRNTGWARRVTREERAAFEQSLRSEGFPDFEIWERDAKGNRIRALDRAEYFPILYPEPAEYTKQVLGFDISSESIRAEALLRARRTEQPTATPPINLITKQAPDGFMNFIPVYAKDSSPLETPRVPEGFMYGVFGTAPMIENILAAKALPPGLDIYFFNPHGSPGNRGIFWYPSRTRMQPVPIPDEDAMRAGPHWGGQIRVADQEWGAIFAPTGELAASRWSWQAGAVLISGLMMTSMIVIYLLISLKRTFRLEFLTTSLSKATEELRRESAKVTKLASLDSMTGLANRATFSGRLATAFAAAKQDDRCFAVFCLDLDHFKDVNDTLGHPSGDLLLQIVAARLKTLVAKNDLIARLGGDEFAILVADVSDYQLIAEIAARIINALKEPYDLDGNEARVSASIGISVFDMKTASPEEMMIQADLALYRAKSAGRNDYIFHSVGLDSEVRERVTISEELHTALRNNELELYYQPQVEVPSGRIVGIEALVRWNHPKRGLLLPGTFLPIAEKSGTIFGLGQWVLEAACQQIKRWQAEGIDPARVAINISAAQFKGSVSLDQQLLEAVSRYAIDPNRIEIELTESTLIEATKANSDTIRHMREFGISIAIDDFGTGYSSLEYLHNNRVNRLKIAQKLMTEVAIKSGDATIVRAALVLARELGMEAIAEGVETAEQLAFLMSAGCRYVQGYYFSRPVPVAEASALLLQGTITRDPAPSTMESVRLAAG